MEAHISEGGDEIEQHAEADGVGREKPPIAQMPATYDQRIDQALGANEVPFARQHQRHDDRGHERDRGDEAESPAASR